MHIELLVIALILILGFGIVIYLLNKKISTKETATNESLNAWLKSMHQSIESTNQTLNEALRANSTDMVKTLQSNSKELNERLDRAAAVIRDVGKEVGQMSEIGRSMKELQEFLKSPKLRGNIGEHVLKDMITQMFPKSGFHLQYTFKSGEKVDAAIKTDAGILPIDAKFPMENFHRMTKAADEKEKEAAEKEFIRDVKKHIDAIAKKYILPSEGTMDFAFMYLPSESVYYEVVNLQAIMDYARKYRVYVVSPSTLYAHLQTILLAFEGKKVETQSKEVFRLLRSLQLDYQKVEENLTVLGKHLTNASSQFGNVTTGFTQLGSKLQSTKMLEEKVVDEIDNQQQPLLKN